MNPLNYMRLHDHSSRNPRQQWTNASNGKIRIFQPVYRPDIIEFTLQHINHDGILGVDVAVNSEGKLRIIETNRAPSWQVFEQATGIDVAKTVIERAIKHLNQ